MNIWRARVFACCAITSIAVGCRQDSSTGGVVRIGEPTPAYSAISLRGDSVSLAGQRGTVVLLNIWATWCHPCRAEIPELRQIHASYQGRGFEVLGVSIDAEGSDESVREFMKEFRMQYPVWLDPGERVSAIFQTIGVPESFLIDKSGILRWRKIGPLTPRDSSLTNAIERAISGRS